MNSDRNFRSEFDVAIVGYGPTGATLANLLAICGVKVLLLDREPNIYHLPRAVHFDDEVMRVFQSIGIAEELSKLVRVNPGMRFLDPQGNLLMDWPRKQEISMHDWHASYRLHQPDLEKLLRKNLEKKKNVTTATEAEVTKLEQTDSEVLITYFDRKNQSERQVRASYLVGCDGANSFVRRTIKSDMEDFGFCERWLVVDVLLKKEKPELGDHSIQFCNPDRPMTYCRSPGNRRRWEITLLNDETSEDVTKPNRVWDFLSPWISEEDAELERSVVYTFRSEIAKKWRDGRILIAGDAAHLMPPFMGQGMCAGIRDASNLAWKLALSIQNKIGSDILDSYQKERYMHVEQYLKAAMRLGGLINSLDREGALVMAKERESGKAKMSSLSVRLGDSSIPNISKTNSPHQGKIFGQPKLSENKRMDDLIGYEPVLITRIPMPPLQGNRKTIDAVSEPSITPFLDDLNVNAVLLRPDRYILATAKTNEEINLLALLISQ